MFLILGFLLITFFFFAKTYPDQFPNRIDTWISRIENFNSNDNLDASYQIQRAKIAINNGGLIGVGAGKSIMKNHLPQSNSDFIFAILLEEYGLTYLNQKENKDKKPESLFLVIMDHIMNEKKKNII